MTKERAQRPRLVLLNLFLTLDPSNLVFFLSNQLVPTFMKFSQWNILNAHMRSQELWFRH